MLTLSPGLDASPQKAIHPGRRPNPLSAGQVDQLVEAFVAGTTVRELAECFGIHRSTVLDHLKRRQVRRRGEWSPALVARASALYEAGSTLDQIARSIRVDPRTVGRQLRAAGVAIQPSGPRRKQI